MAKVLTDCEGVTHLRGREGTTLCGHANGKESEGTLTCSECAEIALRAVELVTKAEKREWRKL